MKERIINGRRLVVEIGFFATGECLLLPIVAVAVDLSLTVKRGSSEHDREHYQEKRMVEWYSPKANFDCTGQVQWKRALYKNLWRVFQNVIFSLPIGPLKVDVIR